MHDAVGAGARELSPWKIARAGPAAHESRPCSSRKHAALAPLYLGIRLVVVRSFARIHLANLINFGIVPAVFANAADYEKVAMGDELHIEGIRAALEGGKNVTITNKTRNVSFEIVPQISARAAKIILAGGLLKFRAS